MQTRMAICINLGTRDTCTCIMAGGSLVNPFMPSVILANSVDPGQAPRHAASDQSLHDLQQNRNFYKT